MNSSYVENGYVIDGYIDDGVFLIPEQDGKVNLKFFASSGKKNEHDFLDDVSSKMGSTDIALVVVPESKKIMLGGPSGFVEFVSAATMPNSISIVGADGTIVTDTDIKQVDENTFEVTVPEDLVGTNYKIVFSK